MVAVFFSPYNPILVYEFKMADVPFEYGDISCISRIILLQVYYKSYSGLSGTTKMEKQEYHGEEAWEFLFPDEFSRCL